MLTSNQRQIRGSKVHTMILPASGCLEGGRTLNERRGGRDGREHQKVRGKLAASALRTALPCSPLPLSLSLRCRLLIRAAPAEVLLRWQFNGAEMAREGGER